MADVTRAESEAEARLPPKLEDGSATGRVQIVAPETWIKKVEEWRRKQPRIPSQSAAIRMLVEQALDAAERHKP